MISNYEEANNYYKLINDSIDQFIVDHKIKPSDIRNYLRGKKLDSFIERLKLTEVSNIRRVIKDVLDDRFYMEKDDVLKFENYSMIKEGFINLDTSNIEYEKVLADLYNTDLGHIESGKKEIHLYKVFDMGINKLVIIFSKSDISKIYSYIENDIYNSICNETIEISSIGRTELPSSLNFNLKSLLKENDLRRSIKGLIKKDNVVEIISNVLHHEYNLISIYKKEVNDYFIWEVKKDKI